MRAWSLPTSRVHGRGLFPSVLATWLGVLTQDVTIILVAVIAMDVGSGDGDDEARIY